MIPSTREGLDPNYTRPAAAPVKPTIGAGRLLTDLERRVTDLEHENTLLWDIVSDLLHVYVCEKCQRVWFDPPTGTDVTGDVRGLVTKAGAYCARNGCLDWLYEASAEWDDAELTEAVFDDVARWLARFPQMTTPAGRWGRDPDISARIERLR